MSINNTSDTIKSFKDRLASLGDIEATSFLGGWGLSIGGCQFVVSIKESFFFQVDDALRESLIAEGAVPFSYTLRNKQIVIQRFYSIPDDIMNDDQRLLEYAGKALEHARREKEQPIGSAREEPNDNVRKVLLVCTSHDKLGDTGNNTGCWFAELANAYKAFSDANFRVVFASPKGGLPPADPGSNSPEFKSPIVMDFEANPIAMSALSHSIALQSIRDISDYEAIMLIGGHGTMWDFPDNPELGRLIDSFAMAEKPIGAVCHGGAGLFSASDETLEKLIKGKPVTCFSNEEEDSIGLTRIVPFLLEDKLKEAGADYTAAKPLRSHIEEAGILITGQNPPSAFGVAQRMVDNIIGGE